METTEGNPKYLVNTISLLCFVCVCLSQSSLICSIILIEKNKCFNVMCLKLFCNQYSVKKIICKIGSRMVANSKVQNVSNGLFFFSLRVLDIFQVGNMSVSLMKIEIIAVICIYSYNIS